MTSGKQSTKPTNELEPLLAKHAISWELFSKKGRPPPGVRGVRQAIVTELHSQGTQWKEMCRITGLSIMSIKHLSLVIGNPASRSNRATSAAERGRARKGGVKPWLSKKLKADWAIGKFDFHKGRKRSSSEKETFIEAAKRPEVRRQRSVSAQNRWLNPLFREHLLTYHRSEEVRNQRSYDQSLRMITNPTKWVRGKAGWADTPKGTTHRVWTRSSYERAFIKILEDLDEVAFYQFELRVKLPSGRWLLPDFIVTYTNGRKALIEVKASWVFKLPEDHKVQVRLRQAALLATSLGWDFKVWTEKGFQNVDHF